MINNNEYAFQQEINARINLRFKTPLEGISFFDTAFKAAKKLEKQEGNFSSWDDLRLLELVKGIAQEKGYLID